MWNIKKLKNGKFEYECFQSSYGYVFGQADTLNEAKVRLALAEADLLETPYPPAVAEEMLSNPDKYAIDFPNPESKNGAYRN